MIKNGTCFFIICLQLLAVAAFGQPVFHPGLNNQQTYAGTDGANNNACKGHPIAHLDRGPYLQVANQTGITIRWRTREPAASRVDVGSSVSNYTISASDTTELTEHVIRVTGLLPDTKYFYRIGGANNWLQGNENNFFTTAPSDTCTHKITFAAFGDCGRNDNGYQSGALGSYQRFLASKNMQAADMMLLLGDNAYQAGTDQEYSDNFFRPYSGILKNHPVFSAPGNHDYANDPLRQVDHQVPYYSNFSMPKSGECGGVPSGTQAYYSFNWGNIHFISLDSYGLEDSGTTHMYDTTGAQAKWLNLDLAANTRKWTIAFWHHPPYTMGSHNSDNEIGLIEIRTHFIKILERNGVDLIICAHSHDYERSYLMKGYTGNEASFSKAAHVVDTSSGHYDGARGACPYTTTSAKVAHGTVYLVAGSAGADGAIQAGWPHKALPFAQDDGGMLYFEVEDNRLDAKFIRRDSVIADQFTIFKDVNRHDTIIVAANDTVQVRASWPGTYKWNCGITDRSRIVIPAHDTILTVSDNQGSTCLTDHIVIRMKSDTATNNPGVIAGSVFPVPAKDVLYLQLMADNDADYVFSIYDIQGRLLRDIYKHILAGQQQLSFDIHDLPADQQMLLKVNTGSKQQAFRFVRLP